MLNYYTGTDAKIYERELGDDKIYVLRSDPFSLLHLKLEKGTLPSKYQGQYTTVDAAISAINSLMEDRRMEVRASKQTKKVAVG